MPTIAIEPSSSQKHRSDVQSYSSAQQCAALWMLKAIVEQLYHHRSRFLLPHAPHDRLCHSCDVPEVSDMQSSISASKEVPRICAPTPLAPATSDCVDVFGLSGLPAEVANILCESAVIATIDLRGCMASWEGSPDQRRTISWLPETNHPTRKGSTALDTLLIAALRTLMWVST